MPNPLVPTTITEQLRSLEEEVKTLIENKTARNELELQKDAILVNGKLERLRDDIEAMPAGPERLAVSEHFANVVAEMLDKIFGIKSGPAPLATHDRAAGT